MKKRWVSLASLFFAASVVLAAVPKPTSWPAVFNVTTVGPIADYLNEPILAARAAYNAHWGTHYSSELEWEQHYLPKYPRDGWLRYTGIPPYQIIGPNCVGGFGLHEFQGHPEITARINEMTNVCLATRAGVTPSAPTATPAAQAATPTPASSGCVDLPLGRPGPFGQCYYCNGAVVLGVENRNGTCVRVSAPTATPRPPVPTTSPRPTATPCVDTAYGRPGPFGQCYTCAGDVVAGAVIGSGGICGPPRVGRTATPTAVPVPTEVPTVAPTPPVEATAVPAATPTPGRRSKGCGGLGGVLFGTVAAMGGVFALRRRSR